MLWGQSIASWSNWWQIWHEILIEIGYWSSIVHLISLAREILTRIVGSKVVGAILWISRVGEITIHSAALRWVEIGSMLSNIDMRVWLTKAVLEEFQLKNCRLGTVLKAKISSECSIESSYLEAGHEVHQL